MKRILKYIWITILFLNIEILGSKLLYWWKKVHMNKSDEEITIK